MVRESKISTDKVFCTCGCGETFVPRSYWKTTPGKHRYMEQKFVSHHWDRVNRKPGKYINKDGYVFTYAKNHHRASQHGRYVFEHILIYEQHYKCCVLRWAIVHHLNDIKTDNRIENLECMIRRNHTFLHNKIRVEKYRIWPFAQHC